MTIRIEVQGIHAAAAAAIVGAAPTLGISTLRACRIRHLYYLENDPGPAALERLCGLLLVDPVTEFATWGAVDGEDYLAPDQHAVEVAVRPGVTDVAARELRRGYILASNAHRDSNQEDLASEFMLKAVEQARKMTGDAAQPTDRLLLADLLKQQAELLVARVNKRSILSQRFSALQESLSLLDESLAIYEELDQATTTELGSPYWSTIELKHRLQDELDSVKRNNQESNRAGGR